jgi:putative phage-type endonuclease
MDIVDQGAFREARRKYIGGSDVAGILGISPWKTPLDIYLDKVQPPVEELDAGRKKVLARGKRMEPYVIDMLAEDEGLEIACTNRRYIDKEHPFIACEIDAETIDGLNIEIKTVSPFKAKEWGEQHTDSIPVHYTAQVMHGLMVTGRDLCILGVLIGGDDFRVYRVQRDDETIVAIRKKEIEFWNLVETKVPPLAQSVSDILKLFSKDTGRTVEATESVLEHCRRLKALKSQISDFEKQAEECEQQIKMFMEDASQLTFSEQLLCTWKSQTTSRFDQKSFASTHQDLFDQFKKSTESRVFRLK